MPEFAGAKGSYIGQGSSQKPIRPGKPPDDALVDLTQRVMKRFSKSRERILQCRQIRRGEKQIDINQDWLSGNKAAAEWVRQLLPERQMIPLNLANMLAAERPQYTRNPKSAESDRAAAQADEFESYINALGRQLIDWDEMVGKATDDGEFAVGVFPSPAVLEYAPDYLTSIGKDGIRKPSPKYDRDERGRRPSDRGYGKRSERASIGAWREELQEYFAANPPFVVRIIPATDCAPILVRGRGRHRWECRGLVTRSLFEIEELLSRKYRWDGMGDRELIQRGFDNDYCRDGQVWLYEAFLTYVDDDGQETPFIARSVGGKDTWTQDADGEETSATIDLAEEYDIHHLMVGYFWGLHHADDDADHRGVPILWPLIQTILRVEGLSTAAAVHVDKNAFTGHVASIEATTPPEAYMEGNEFRKFTKPGPDEITIAPGPVQPWAQASVGRDTWQLIQQERQILSMNTPDESQTGGQTDASGHAMVVSHELLESAKRQIKEGVREAYEFIGECLTELACGLARGDWAVLGGMKVNVPVYEDVARTASSGHTETVTEMIEFNESWVGNNYSLTADYPNQGNIAIRQQTIEAWQKGACTFSEMRRIAYGDMAPETSRREIARDSVMQSPLGQMMLQIEVMRERHMRAQRMVLEAQLAGEITKLGIPIDALAPELMDEFQGAMQQGQGGAMQGTPQGLPQGMPQGGQAPGGMAQLPSMASNVLGGEVSGIMGTASRQADAQAQVAVNPTGAGGP